MEFTSICAMIAFILSLIAYVPYFYLILKNRTRPSLSSWISWCAVDLVLLVGMLSAGTIAWQLVAYVIGCLSIIGAMFFTKTFEIVWSRVDTACLFMVVLAILFWVLSGDLHATIVFSLLAVTVGSVPTYIKLWKNPDSEPLSSWALTWSGGVFGMFAIQTWDIVSALTPVWFFCLQSFVCLLILRRTFSLKIH